MNPEKTPNAQCKKARWASVLCPCTCATVVLLLISVVLMTLAWRRHDGTLVAGWQSSLSILMKAGPLFLAGVLVAGMLGTFMPESPPQGGSIIPKSIWVSTAIFLALVVVCMTIAYRRHDGSLATGLQETWIMFTKVWVLLVVAWLFAGYIGVLLPEGFVEHWLGRESGIKGILMASVFGGLTPGGPFVSLPIVTGLIRAGASEGVIVAYLTGWSLYAIGRIPIEIGFMDVKLTAIRFISVIIFPPIAGLSAGLVSKLLFQR